MSSNRPPQLQLSLSLAEGNGTSFKRSFEQYGFDLETPVNGEASGSGSGLSGSSERDERNKRARSESSTVESVGSSASSSDHSSVPESSSALGTMNVQEDGLSAARPISVDEELFATSIPSSLPMAHQSNQILSQVDSQISPSAPTSTSDHLRASLERFSAFDGEISALRRPPTAPPTLPPISALADTDDRHSFGLDLDMMEENSGVPGLQVFSLGEFHTDVATNSHIAANSRTAAPRLRDFPQRRTATLSSRSLVEPLSTPVHPHHEGWWSSEFSIGETFDRLRAEPPRDATDYMPPRDWFDAAPSPSEQSLRAASWAFAPSNVPRRPYEFPDLGDDDEEPYSPPFPPAPSDPDWYRTRRSSALDNRNDYTGRDSGAPPMPFSRIDWAPNEELRAPPLRSPEVEGPSNRNGPIRNMLPSIDTSDFDVDFPASTNDVYGRPRYDYTHRIPERPLGFSSMYTRRSTAPAVDIEETTTRVPSLQTAGRPPSVRGRLSSRSYSSRAPTSNSLVSETAAEMRRTISRSQMLPTVPHHDDSFDFSSPSDSDNPWQDRRPITVPRDSPDEYDTLARLRSRIRGADATSSLHYHATPSQSREHYGSLSTTQIRGGFAEASRRIDEPSSALASLRRLQAIPSERTLGTVDRLRASALGSDGGSPPTLPFSSGWSTNTRSGNRAFPSSTDAARRTSRPHSPTREYLALNRLRALTAVARETDPDLRARARQRSSVADVGLFRSPSPDAAHDRNSPLSADPPRAAPSSAYESLDLSVYHQGPFRASLQRSLDLDRIRSRLNRLESLADPAPASSASALPPSLPPLHFESDDDLLVEHRPRPAPNPVSERAQSSATDPDLNFPHLVREARLGRGHFPEPPALPNSQTYGNHIMGPGETGNIRMEGDRWASWRARVEALSTEGSSATQRATGERNLNMSRPPFFHSSGLNSRDRLAARDFVHSPTNTRSAFPLGSRPTEVSHHTQVQERVNGLRAQIRASVASATPVRVNQPRSGSPSRADISGDFREAMDILSADGLSETTTRSLYDRYLERNGDRERFSTADDPGEAGTRFWPSRARYARRGRFPRQAEPAETGNLPRFRSSNTSNGQIRASSISPTRGNPERPGVASAILNERTARARAARDRAHRDRDFFMGEFPRFDVHHFTHRTGRNVGDYVRDEDFDSSYESLMSLASTLGEARPRATPNDIIASLPTGSYQDWRTPDSDERCPICLDDYQPSDPLLKLSDCSHWLHKGCLEQWLHSARTCPVCRKRVNGPRNARRATGEAPTPSGSSSHRRHGPGDDHGHGADMDLGTPPWRLWD